VVLSTVVLISSMAASPTNATAAGLRSEPRVGPETAVTKPAISTAPGSQDLASVAWNGTVFLVVWADQRIPSESEIRATRVTSDGRVLDGTGLVLSSQVAGSPAVASDGGRFLVTWVDARSGTPQTYGARVDGDGTILDPGGFPIDLGSGPDSYPAVAWTGATYLVSWAHGAAGADILAARVGPEGTVLDTDPIIVSSAHGTQTRPAIASRGVDTLVVWEDHRASSPDVFGARVSAGGVVLEPKGISLVASPDAEVEPAVAWNGTRYLLSWIDKNARGAAVVLVQPFGPDGVVIGPASQLTSPNLVAYAPAVASAGQAFLVTWHGWIGSPAILGQRVDVDGLPLGDPILVGETNYWYLRSAIAWTGTLYLVAYTGVRQTPFGDDPNVADTRIDADGDIIGTAGAPISRAAASQQPPGIASNGRVALVAWTENRRGVMKLLAGRLDGSGTPLDPSGIRIASGVPFEWAPPAVASDGADFLIAWSGDRVLGVRVSADGLPLDRTPLALPGGRTVARSLAAVWTGSSYLISWTTGKGILASRVAPDGTVLDRRPIVVATNGYYGSEVAASYDGADTVVAWTAGNLDHQSVWAARVTPDGQVLDEPIRVGANSGFTSPGPVLRVASGADESLIAWLGIVDQHLALIGKRIDAGGALLDQQPLLISGQATSPFNPSLGWDGQAFVAAWTDGFGGQADVVAARVTPGGHLPDPVGVAVASGADAEMFPSIASGPGDRALIAYLRTATEERYGGVDRTFVRSFEEP